MTSRQIKHDFCIFSNFVNFVRIDLKIGTHIYLTNAISLYHIQMHQYKLCNTYIHGNQIPHGMGVFLNFNRGIISPIHTGRILMKYHMDIRAHIMRSACDKKIEHRSKVKVTENTKITLAWHQLIRCLQLVGQNA